MRGAVPWHRPSGPGGRLTRAKAAWPRPIGVQPSLPIGAYCRTSHSRGHSMTHPLDASSAPGSTPRETRLADYRPPAFLVDTVDLTFELDEADTRVSSRLAVRRNPAGDPGAPLRLDGEALDLVSRNARRRTARRQPLPRRGRPARHPRGARRRDAGDRDAHRAEGQHAADRTVRCPTAVSSPNARPRASAASPTSPTAPT